MFLPLSSLIAEQNGGSDAAVTDNGYCWGENEQFYGPTLSHVLLQTINYSKVFRIPY